MKEFLNLIINIITDAKVVMGIVVLIGMVLQKKSFNETLTSTIKTIMGLIIMSAGSSLVTSVTSTLLLFFQKGMNTTGVVPLTNPYVADAFEQDFAYLIGYIVLGSFLINFVLARFTRFKYIFLSGHHILYIAIVLIVCLKTLKFNDITIILLGSVLAGILLTLSPAINQKQMRKITGNVPFAIGQFGSVGYWLCTKISSKIGNPEDSCEEVKLPKWLGFASDTTLSASLVMLIMYLIILAVMGPDFIKNSLKLTDSLALYLLIQSVTFGAGIWIMMNGVRMMVNEIITAFEGISKKLVPDSVPALDCPTVFQYSPNAVVLGFMTATITCCATSIIFSLFTNVLLVPCISECFYAGATAAVFGNSAGGKKGAVVSSILQGLLIAILPYFYWQFTSGVFNSMYTMVSTDFCLVAIVIHIIGKLFGLV
ncbi:MAG: PTS ascorbate transporter subunit IIC [Erysipelotrichaceae bacterium]|nr:PTS ascorbate transporter subunit IIC [Erysipelotrichaceae bacterium]